eukprot:44774-Amorphochlora_amoeboformis.AAC.1
MQRKSSTQPGRVGFHPRSPRPCTTRTRQEGDRERQEGETEREKKRERREVNLERGGEKREREGERRRDPKSMCGVQQDEATEE